MGRSREVAMAREDLVEETLTIVAEDLDRVSPVTAGSGPDASWAEARRTYRELARRESEKQSGAEVGALGDGYLFAFTSVRRAVACAVGIQRAVAERGQKFVGVLAVRIGVDCGEVLRDGKTLVGAPVNAATRIAELAEPGQILVSPVVRELAEKVRGASFVDRGSFTLRGFPEQRQLHEVVWEGQRGMRVSTRERTRFVGRAKERAELRRSIELAEAGTGGVVLVGGEPGVGKTRLAEEMAAEATVRGMLTLSGRCYESIGSPPYIPFVEIIEAAVRELPADSLREVLGDAAAEVARLVPQLRQLFPEMPTPLDLPSGQSQRFLFTNVGEVVGRLGARQPVLLHIDDVHWADESTLLLVEHLAERLVRWPVLIIATYRDVELSTTHPLSRAMEDLIRRRLAHRVSLRRLPEQDVEAMLVGLGGPRPPSEVVHAIWAETEGNPFFVEELFRHLAEEGRLFEDQGRWRSEFHPGELDVPESVRLVIGRRLERLGGDTRRILSAAAVIGRGFSFELLGLLGEGGASSVVEAMNEAERAGLLVPVTGGGETRFGFSHELIRQTLLVGLSTLERQRIHARVAEAMETLYGEDPDRAGDLAHHLLEAGSTVDAMRAARYLARAGDRSLEAAAHDEALRSFDAALALHRVNDRARADMLFGSGRALRSLGRWNEVIPRWREAIGVYEAAGELDAAGRACREAANQLSWAARWEEALEMAGRGLAALEGRVGADRARLLAEVTVLFAASGYREAAEQMLHEAHQLARGVGDPELVGHVLTMESIHDLFFMRTSHGASTGRRAVEILRPSGALWDLATAFSFLSVHLAFLGETEQCAGLREEAEPLAARLGHHGALMALLRSRILGHALAGDLEAYERGAEEELELDRSAQLPWIAGAHLWLGVVMFWRGSWDDALERYRRGTSLEVAQAFVGWGLGLLLLVTAYQGRKEEALAIVEEQRPDMPGPGKPGTIGAWGMLLAAVEALAMMSERDAAAELYPSVLEAMRGGQLIRPFDGRLLETLAGIAAAAGRRWSDAERHFERALALAERLPHRIEKPEARRFYAGMLIDRDEPEDRIRARSLLKEAIEGYRRLGMPRHEEMARTLLKGIRVRRPLAAGPDGLASNEAFFRREGDYWTVAYEARVSRLKDSSGLRCLAQLLAHPGSEFHSLDLVAARSSPLRKTAADLTDLSVRSGLGDAGEVLDPAAKAAYRRRMEELANDLREAEEWHDLERAAVTQAEIDALAEELSRAVGLGGRDRKAASVAERARVNATKAIRGAIKKIAEQHPSLGHHLDASVRTGTFCSYEPDPSRQLTWKL
jgi:class 3 adenylate cyclase/tetratricopeptide (TPR) repeat protein